MLPNLSRYSIFRGEIPNGVSFHSLLDPRGLRTTPAAGLICNAKVNINGCGADSESVVSSYFSFGLNPHALTFALKLKRENALWSAACRGSRRVSVSGEKPEIPPSL